jgi:hypothetical protein
LGKFDDQLKQCQTNRLRRKVFLTNLSFTYSAYPNTGSFSRTAIKARSGVRTPLAGVFSAAVVVLSLYALTPAFYYIPDSILAAVIIHAVSDLVSGPKFLKQLWHVNPLELYVFSLEQNFHMPWKQVSNMILLFLFTEALLYALSSLPFSLLWNTVSTFLLLFPLSFSWSASLAHDTLFLDAFLSNAPPMRSKLTMNESVSSMFRNRTVHSETTFNQPLLASSASASMNR